MSSHGPELAAPMITLTRDTTSKIFTSPSPVIYPDGGVPPPTSSRITLYIKFPEIGF
jgi:hypothetical protein